METLPIRTSKMKNKHLFWVFKYNTYFKGNSVLTMTTTGSDSFRCTSKVTKLVCICSRNGCSLGPLPNLDRLPNRVNAAARTAGVGWRRGGREI